MKTFYSSAFLSIILTFFVFIGISGKSVDIIKSDYPPSFSNISEPPPLSFLPESGSEYDSISHLLNVEVFNTFGCSSCDSFAISTFVPLREQYAADERINIKLYMVADLNNENEYTASLGVHCASEQGRYDDMFRALHTSEDFLNKREIDLIAQSIGINIVPFRKCLYDEKYRDKITEDNSYAEEKNIAKKPTILIGDYILSGNQPIENIEMIIERILAPST